MVKDPVNMLIHAIFPNYFDENGNYIGEPLTKKEESELKKLLTELDISKEEIKKTIESLSIQKEESEMIATTENRPTTGNALSFTSGNTTYTGSVVYCLISVNPDGSTFCNEITNGGYIGKEGIITANGRQLRTGKCLKVEKSYFSKKEGKTVTRFCSLVELPKLDYVTIKSVFDGEVNKDIAKRSNA